MDHLKGPPLRDSESRYLESPKAGDIGSGMQRRNTQGNVFGQTDREKIYKLSNL